MRVINGLIFIVCGMGIVMICHQGKGDGKDSKWILFLKKHSYLLLILMTANVISFVLTYSEKVTEIYIEKGAYGDEEKQIPFVLQSGKTTEEFSLPVVARKYTKEQLEEQVAGAFSFLKENMKGENPSLDEVRSALDYSLDVERFPFDAEFVSEDYALIDGEGNVKNEEEELKGLGYTEEEMEKGIGLNVTVTLWYEAESFEQVFPVVVYPKEKSTLELRFESVEKALQQAEREAAYEEGFYVPAVIEDVGLTRKDEEGITSWQVLITGVGLAGLLLLREQENTKQEEKKRKEMLLRSYPWFVNEMVLLLGAGMQVRNIFKMLIQDLKEGTADYRKPLMEEMEKTVRAMELGMSEEQAYYQLGRRLKLPCYIKLMTLLEQNVKRGAKGLTVIFEQEELQALEERKNLAKRYGEEAGTKLLGPMMVLLIVILLMIMIPAFWGMM